MQNFSSGGVPIAYETAGDGPPILLVHGFASTGRVNWWDTGWVRVLADAGRRVITFDHRGHGASGKLYDSNLYSPAAMAGDALGLLDHLGIAAADVMGYSMGARVAAVMAIASPERLRRAVLAGLASRMITGIGGSDAIALALEAGTASDVADPAARAFRVFAEQTRSDLPALAACIRASRARISEAELATIRVPVLVVAGEKDEVAGDVATLVRAIPGAEGLTLPGRNHMNAVGDRGFKQAVLAFLA